jgi:hypothetical protein
MPPTRGIRSLVNRARDACEPRIPKVERKPDQTPAAELIRLGLRSLGAAPFRTLWLVGLLIAIASPSLVERTDEYSLVGTVLFGMLGAVVEMATVVAATETEPDRSADLWIKGAVRRRAFWRFVLATFVTELVIAVGLLGLIVGGILLAGIVGLAPQAALLERRGPFQALARSAELTRARRGPIRMICAVLVVLPALLSTLPAVAYLAGGTTPPPAVQILIGASNTTFALAAYIALTRAYVELGGGTKPVDPTPAARLEPPPDR